MVERSQQPSFVCLMREVGKLYKHKARNSDEKTARVSERDTQWTFKKRPPAKSTTSLPPAYILFSSASKAVHCKSALLTIAMESTSNVTTFMWKGWWSLADFDGHMRFVNGNHSASRRSSLASQIWLRSGIIISSGFHLQFYRFQLCPAPAEIMEAALILLSQMPPEASRNRFAALKNSTSDSLRRH